MIISLVLKPLCVALITIILVQCTGLDLYLSGLIYSPAHQWLLKNNALLETVIHRGGRLFIATLLTAMLLAAIVSLLPRFRGHPYKAIVWYLLISTLLCIVSVSILKQLTTLPCPWDVDLFGGNRDYLWFTQALSASHPVGHCFPSGHASGGFSLFSCYFAALRVNQIRGTLRVYSADILWLLPGAVTGGIFGIAQQLRGAHFLSHDIASAAVCWLICSSVAYILWRQRAEGTQNEILVPTISAD